MPGLSLVYDPNGKLARERPHLIKRLTAVCHGPDYACQVLLDEPHCLAACTRYAAYPATVVENGDLWVYLEGRLFGASPEALRDDLLVLARHMLSSGEAARREVAAWVESVDGDFVVLARDAASGRLALLNDALGRLHLHRREVAGRLVVSRELGFAATAFGPSPFDRIAIAQFLLLLYPLGSNTVFREVKVVPPGALLVIDPRASRVTTSRLWRLDLSAQRHAKRTTVANAEALADLFVGACKRRGQPQPVVLALSGGLDSRAVAAGLHRGGVPFSCVSWRDAHGYAGGDARIAAHLARLLGVPRQQFDIGMAAGADVLRLLSVETGMLSARTAFLVPFFERVREVFGPALSYFTGDGGDKTMPDLSPARALRGVDDLVRYIVDQNSILALDDVAAVTQLSCVDVREAIRDDVESYPEPSYDHRYVHFLLANRAMKWRFAAEDRNRSFFWSQTPFYARGFFDYAMNCHSAQKMRNGLYRKFLMRLSSQLARVADQNLGCPISSVRYRIARCLLAHVMRYPRAWKAVRCLVRPHVHKTPYGDGASLLSCLREQLSRCDALGGVLSLPALHAILHDHRSHSKLQLEMLFAVVSLIERHLSATSTLEDYREVGLV